MSDIICPVRKAAGKYSNKVALISPDKKITYFEFDQLVNKTSQWLSNNNIRKNDRVAILAENCIEYPVLLFALFRVGAMAVPLNYRMPEQSLTVLLEEISVSHLIIDESEDLSSSKLSIPKFNLDTIIGEIDEIEYQEYESQISLDQDATIIFTSGSSGHPKGALHTFGNHYYNAKGSNENIQLQQGDRWAVTLPFFHVGGLGILFRTILAGAALVIQDKNEKIEDTIIGNKVSHCSLVATQLYRLLNSESLSEIKKTLNALLIGGGRIPSDLIDRAINAGLPIHTTYGLTEMASQVTTTPPNADIELLKTSGKLLNHRKIKLSKDGEILVSGETLFKGYFNSKDIEVPFDNNGYFHTGDMGSIDEMGYLIVSGRKDNMFISGGENIHPETIEATLSLLEGIEEAIVVAKDDPEFGQIPVAFLKSSRKIESMEIEKSIRGSLPGYMIPIAFYELKDEYKQGGIKYNREKLREIAEDINNAKRSS